MPLLFCYGSNNPAQLAARIGVSRAIYAAYSPSYKRVFRGWSNKWQGGVATLTPSLTRPAYGYVASVTSADLAKLDVFEGVQSGHYERVLIDVTVFKYKGIPESSQRAIAYIKYSDDFNRPSREYLEAIAKTIGTFWQIDGPSDIKVE